MGFVMGTSIFRRALAAYGRCKRLSKAVLLSAIPIAGPCYRERIDRVEWVFTAVLKSGKVFARAKTIYIVDDITATMPSDAYYVRVPLELWPFYRGSLVRLENGQTCVRVEACSALWSWLEHEVEPELLAVALTSKDEVTVRR